MEENVENKLAGTEQARRWCFTINNPLGTDVEEIDISKTDIPIKEDYYDKSIISELENSECFIFKYVKISIHEDEMTSKEYIVRRPFFKSIESAITYFSGLESFKYCIFQLEKGEVEGTTHFQGFIIFTGGKRFRTIKRMLPFAHLEKVRGSNTQNREYCSKQDTRIEGPFEMGKFAEQRERTDVKEFIELVRAGTDEDDLSRLYPTLFMKEMNKLDKLYALNFKKYRYMCRDIKVTYIYGPSGLGKSSMIRRELGMGKAFWVHSYDLAMFTNYNYEDNIVFDEFIDRLPISTLNMYLNVEPIELRGLNSLKYGAYHNVYIISNYAPKDLYKDVQNTRPDIFETFYRRLNTIIRMDKKGNKYYERITEWEECENEIDRSMGIMLQTSKVYDIDKDGNKTLVYDRHKKDDEDVLIPVETTPFDDLFDEDGRVKF